MHEERVLVYDRIDANRRLTWLLLALFAFVSLPVAAYVAQYLMLVLAVVLTSSGFGDLLWGESWVLGLVVTAAISLAILLAVAYLQYTYAGTAVLRVAGARELGRDEEPELWRTVENLCIGAGLPQPRVYLVESAAANAFSTGMEPRSAALVVTRGLLRLLDRRELEGVIARELSQIGNQDIRLATILAAGVGMLRLPLAVVTAVIRFLFRIHWAVGGGVLLYFAVAWIGGMVLVIDLILDVPDGDPVAAVLVLLGMVLPLYVLFVAPLIGEALRALTLREREYLADADGLLLTRHNEGLALALVKLGAAASMPMKVTAATSHLYVVQPSPQDIGWWGDIFSTHPPIGERVAMLAAMGGGIPPSALQAAAEVGSRFRSADHPAPVAARTRRERDQPAAKTGAADEAKLRLVAFRLAADATPLYAEPDTTSTEVEQLPVGTLITVSVDDGEFLRVITDRNLVGYIPRTAATEKVELSLPE